MLRFLLIPLVITSLQQTHWTEGTVLSKILDQFHDYGLVLHYENKQSPMLQQLFRAIAQKTKPVYLTNNVSKTKPQTIFENQLLHIFLVENLQNSTADYDINMKDVVVVVVVNDLLLNETQRKFVCGNGGLRKARAVFLVELPEGNVSTCCYYCGLKKITIRNIPKSNGNVPVLTKFLNNFTNFAGYTFKVGFVQFPPQFYYKNPNENKYYGIESHILKISSKILNYKYTATEFIETDKEVNQVHKGKLDWAISGISHTLTRMQLNNVEYTRYIIFQKYMLVYRPYEDNYSSTIQLINRLYISNWKVILLASGSMLAIALITGLSSALPEKSKQVREYLMVLLLCLVEQNSKLRRYVKYKFCIKLLFILWLFVSIPLVVSYKSIIAYFLMTTEPIIDTVESLTRKGFKLQIFRNDYANIKQHCSYSTSEFCKTTLDKLSLTNDDTCVLIENVLNGKTVFIDEAETLKYMVLQKCNLTTSEQSKLKFLIIDDIPQEWYGWLFHKSSPFIRNFSNLIGRMESSGLLQHWSKKKLKWYSNFNINKTQMKKEKEPLGLTSFIHPLIILVAGYLISTVAFLNEVCNVKYPFFRRG